MHFFLLFDFSCAVWRALLVRPFSSDMCFCGSPPASLCWKTCQATCRCLLILQNDIKATTVSIYYWFFSLFGLKNMFQQLTWLLSPLSFIHNILDGRDQFAFFKYIKPNLFQNILKSGHKYCMFCTLSNAASVIGFRFNSGQISTDLK